MRGAWYGRNLWKKVLGGMEWSEALLLSVPGSFTEQRPSLTVDIVSSLSDQDGDSRGECSELQRQGWGKGRGTRPVEYFLNLLADGPANIFLPSCPGSCFFILGVRFKHPYLPPRGVWTLTPFFFKIIIIIFFFFWLPRLFVVAWGWILVGSGL